MTDLTATVHEIKLQLDKMQCNMVGGERMQGNRSRSASPNRLRVRFEEQQRPQSIARQYPKENFSRETNLMRMRETNAEMPREFLSENREQMMFNNQPVMRNRSVFPGARQYNNASQQVYSCNRCGMRADGNHRCLADVTAAVS